MSKKDNLVERAFAPAKERYAALGVDADCVLEWLQTIAISLHCWQGDDVGGFENAGNERRPHVTGNYPDHHRG